MRYFSLSSLLSKWGLLFNCPPFLHTESLTILILVLIRKDSLYACTGPLSYAKFPRTHLTANRGFSPSYWCMLSFVKSIIMDSFGSFVFVIFLKGFAICSSFTKKQDRRVHPRGLISFELTILWKRSYQHM